MHCYLPSSTPQKDHQPLVLTCSFFLMYSTALTPKPKNEENTLTQLKVCTNQFMKKKGEEW